MTGRVGTLVTPEYVEARLLKPGLRVLDASWYAEGSGRNADAEFVAGHIPGARRFDLDIAAASDSPFSHTLPTPGHFAAYAGACGVASEDEVVIYDAGGMSASARAWWVFKVHGHERVSVLDGGLDAWKRQGRRLERGEDRGVPAHYPQRPRTQHRLADMQAVAAAASRGLQVVDARPAARFAGEAAEPRPELRRGHIPGSVNLAWTRLIDAATGTFRGDEDITALFREAGADPQQPVICTCGSGVTACALALALEHIGNTRVAVYDGSWTEWATRHP
jgi:thiosulfate/3-mercaptopyruvate sulfurtransferase